MATFNFSSLQQKQDQLIYTIDEIVEMLRKLPLNGYQTVEYYDKKGNLVRKQIPNIGQLIDQFRQGVNAQMSKTVYLDRVNGSDTSGDGSPNAPFKSIPKAENSVPPSGIVNIKLLSDYTIEDAIRIDNNRIVVITGAEVNPDGSPIITLRNNPNNIRSKIVITDAILILDNIRLECNNNGDKPHWSTLLKVGNYRKATISIGHWVDLSQYRHPVRNSSKSPDVEYRNVHMSTYHKACKSNSTYFSKLSDIYWDGIWNWIEQTLPTYKTVEELLLIDLKAIEEEIFNQSIQTSQLP